MKKFALGLLALVFVTASVEAAHHYDSFYDTYDPYDPYDSTKGIYKEPRRF